MSRIAVQVDERLLEIAMERHGFNTPQAAIDYALDRAILAATLGSELSRDQVPVGPGDGCHTSPARRAADAS